MVHGGVYASVAEALATLGSIDGIRPGESAVGLSNSTSFLRPVSEGVLHARAERRHRGRTTWVWVVAIRDDHQRLRAITRMTIAVRAGGQEPGSR